MQPTTIMYKDDYEGQAQPSLDDPRGWCKTTFFTVECYNTIGDADGDGTALLSKAIPTGYAVILKDLCLASLVNDVTVQVVISSTAAVGGTETDLLTFQLQGAGVNKGLCPTLSKFMEPPIIYYRNVTGSTTYLNVYLPQARAGGTGNNAVTEYITGFMSGLLEPV